MGLKTRFITFSQIHNKTDVGSTNIRVMNLLKHWEGAGLYKYGEDVDCIIFQKVYVTQDYKFPVAFKGLKILDICDPDWLDGAMVRETVDHMDAITCPTESIAEFFRNMTDKPVRIIKDRFDLDKMPEPIYNRGPVKTVVWFGYSHNSETIKFAMPSIQRLGLNLLVVSNEDVFAWRWAENEEEFKKKYQYIRWDSETAYSDIQKADVAILPKGLSIRDKFKSNNKTVTANLLGLPVVKDSEALDIIISMPSSDRIDYIKHKYEQAVKEYDVRESVREYKHLIGELQ